ncbi:MAG: hypothetical protein ACR2K0_10005 [Acidimicrobiales bacterium]
MHAGHDYDEAQSRWHSPPAVEEGQVAHVDAPTAAALVLERSPDASAPR